MTIVLNVEGRGSIGMLGLLKILGVHLNVPGQGTLKPIEFSLLNSVSVREIMYQCCFLFPERKNLNVE